MTLTWVGASSRNLGRGLCNPSSPQNSLHRRRHQSREQARCHRWTHRGIPATVVDCARSTPLGIAPSIPSESDAENCSSPTSSNSGRQEPALRASSNSRQTAVSKERADCWRVFGHDPRARGTMARPPTRVIGPPLEANRTFLDPVAWVKCLPSMADTSTDSNSALAEDTGWRCDRSVDRATHGKTRTAPLWSLGASWSWSLTSR